MHRLDDEDLQSYLGRLGVVARPPSADGLDELHRAHVAYVPYETVWLHLGEPRGIGQRDAVHDIAHRGRGGYCFHLNGAFAALLTSLGYRVTMHLGGVHDAPTGDDHAPIALGNHMVLLVHDLPTDDHPDGTWYVDAGLGDALFAPIPLRPVAVHQVPFVFELRRSPAPGSDWQFVHDPSGSFYAMAFRAAPAELRDFEADHRHLSTSPESGFVRTLTVQRRDGGGVDVIRARTRQRRDASGTTTEVLDRTEWFDALRDTFGLDLSDVDAAARDRLWSAVAAQHERHLTQHG